MKINYLFAKCMENLDWANISWKMKIPHFMKISHLRTKLTFSYCFMNWEFHSSMEIRETILSKPFHPMDLKDIAKKISV